MRHTALLFLLIMFLNQYSFAQQMDGSALEQAQSGEVSFMEGEFVAFLADTTSPDFALNEFQQQGFEVVFSDINPIRIKIVNSPDQDVLNRIEVYPGILSVEVVDSQIDTTSYRTQLQAQGMSGELLDQAMDRILASGNQKAIYVNFDYSVTSRQVAGIMGTFREVAYMIDQDFPKSVNIKTKPGEEQAVMEKIEKLPFVTWTALIAVLEN